jgi:hypothetical protein
MRNVRHDSVSKRALRPGRAQPPLPDRGRSPPCRMVATANRRGLCAALSPQSLGQAVAQQKRPDNRLFCDRYHSPSRGKLVSSHWERASLREEREIERLAIIAAVALLVSTTALAGPCDGGSCATNEPIVTTPQPDGCEQRLRIADNCARDASVAIVDICSAQNCRKFRMRCPHSLTLYACSAGATVPTAPLRSPH